MFWILMYSSRETDTIGGMRFGIILIDLMLCELVNRRMDRIRLLFLLSFTLSVTAVPVCHENNAVYKCPQLETLTNQRLQQDFAHIVRMNKDSYIYIHFYLPLLISFLFSYSKAIKRCCHIYHIVCKLISISLVSHINIHIHEISPQ